MTSKASKIIKTDSKNESKKESKKESPVSNMDKEIILYNFDTGKNEKFVVRPGAKLTFEYTLGTAFEYKINDDDKFSDYCDLIQLVDSRGKEHDVIVKHTVLSGDMCLPPVTNSRGSGYSGYSKSRYNDGYSNGYSDPDDFDDDYDVAFTDYMNSKYTEYDEYNEDDGYECGGNDDDE
jgi:hypothetical protein